MNAEYNAVLFDLDGTLLDTLQDLADSMNAALEQFAFPPHPTEAFRYFVGDGIVAMAERALPENHRDNATVRQCVEAMREQYANRWDNKTKPYPGVAELLNGLDERGLKTAVLSNKADDFTKLTITKLLAPWKFHVVLGVHDGIPPKPDPAGALETARRLEVAPENILYLGDTNTDMQTARAADMFPVGALWGFRSAEELEQNGARVLVERPQDVLDLL